MSTDVSVRFGPPCSSLNANADPSPGWSSRPDPHAGQSPGLHRVHDRGQGTNPGQNHGQEQDKSQGLEVSRTSR